MQTEILRAFKFTLDPTNAQVEALSRHAGAARWAFNHALAAKIAAHEQWRGKIATLVEAGIPEAEARKTVRIPFPDFVANTKAWTLSRDLPMSGGGSPWHRTVSSWCFRGGFRDADDAWKNWIDSYSGRRSGLRVGYPRLKKKGRARDSFRLHHNTKRPSIRLASSRRILLPKIGEMRLHSSAKRLVRLISRGEAVVRSVTVSRGGHRWYASVLCSVTVSAPEGPTRRQRERGVVGVDLGVKYLAALSRPLVDDELASRFVGNPRHLAQARKRLVKAQRAFSRTDKGSARREKAKRRLGRLHHEVAVRRRSALHQVTKRLAKRFAVVAVEDLSVSAMTRSARGTMDSPGKRVRQKAGLNRSILDAAPSEFRRQLAYKTSWYGSKLAVLDRWFPSSKTCSNCGWRNPSLTLADRTFHCDNCKSAMDRDLNAARNIERHAVIIDQSVACDTRETKNARGAPVRPTTPKSGRRGAPKREDPADASAAPSQQSDPLALQFPEYKQPALF